MNEVTVAEPRHPLALYEMALNQNVDPDKLEKLLDLAERVDERNAKKEFAAAFVRAQQRIYNAPPIVKSKDGNKSKYAQLEAIQYAVEPILSSEGFAVSYSNADPVGERSMRITATLFHSGGHSKEYFCDLPIDKSGAMNDVQGHGSTMSYGRRYLLVLMFNIPLIGEDNDGQGAIGPLINEAACALLDDMIREVQEFMPADKRDQFFPALMGWASEVAKTPIRKLDEIPFSIFGKVKEKILEKQRAQAGRKGAGK